MEEDINPAMLMLVSMVSVLVTLILTGWLGGLAFFNLILSPAYLILGRETLASQSAVGYLWSIASILLLLYSWRYLKSHKYWAGSARPEIFAWAASALVTLCIGAFGIFSPLISWYFLTKAANNY